MKDMNARLFAKPFGVEEGPWYQVGSARVLPNGVTRIRLGGTAKWEDLQGLRLELHKIPGQGENSK